VREKLDDPKYSSWFIKFKDYTDTPYPGGTGKDHNSSYHVPTCDWYGNATHPPKCSGFYHDQEQTPEHPYDGTVETNHNTPTNDKKAFLPYAMPCSNTEYPFINDFVQYTSAPFLLVTRCPLLCFQVTVFLPTESMGHVLINAIVVLLTLGMMCAHTLKLFVCNSVLRDPFPPF
jgi:hypothetical protein